MVYQIRAEVSDAAGRKLAVFRAGRSGVNTRTLTVNEALDMILMSLPAIEKMVDEHYEQNKHKLVEK
jgi:hypothetical protein